MFRFTIRELVLLTLVMALPIGWAVDRWRNFATKEINISRANAFGEEPVPNVPEHYWFLYEPNWPIGESREAVVRARLPFEWIELERRAGPLATSYVVKFKNDGTASYEGGTDATTRGRVGEVSTEEFGRLCYFLEKFGVEYLPTDIRSRDDHGSHASSTTIRAKKVGSKEPFEVSEINSNGPIDLWAAQMAIDAVCDKIAWKSRPD